MPGKQHSPKNVSPRRVAADDYVSACGGCYAAGVPDAVQRLFGAAARCAASGERFRQPLSRRTLLVLAVLDQIVDYCRIRQRRGIAEASRLVLGDLAQDAAHDLDGTGFRQS